MNKLFSIIIIYIITLFSTVKLSAQAVATDSKWSSFFDLAYDNILLVIALLVLLGVIMAGLRLINTLIDVQKIKLLDQYGPEVLENAKLTSSTSMWANLSQKLWGLKPMDEQHTIEMDHEYDGIRELDNSLPPWWVYLFYITIIWGIGYFAYYHLTDYGMNQEEEYKAELEQGEIQKAAFLAAKGDMVNETTVTYLEDEKSLAEGKEIFMANCVACHGANGEGNSIGPNLTDKYWIHGGSINNVFSVIKYGVQAKGMQAWQSQLRPQVMQKVASYILSLQGTNPAGAKEPQGDLYVPAEAENVENAVEVGEAVEGEKVEEVKKVESTTGN